MINDKVKKYIFPVNIQLYENWKISKRDIYPIFYYIDQQNHN